MVTEVEGSKVIATAQISRDLSDYDRESRQKR